jgi:hypothetical protein
MLSNIIKICISILDNKLKENWFQQEEMEEEPKKLWEDKSLEDIMIWMLAVLIVKKKVSSLSQWTKYYKTVLIFVNSHIDAIKTGNLKSFGKLSESFKYMLNSTAQNLAVIFAIEKNFNILQEPSSISMFK